MNQPNEEQRLRAARYLAGMLSPEDARRFEESVIADPQLIDQLGLGEQLERASRLVDTERLGEKTPWWHDRRAPLVGGAAILVLLVASVWFAVRAGIVEDRMAMLEARFAAGSLMPPSATRTVRADPEGGKAVRLGGGETTERVEILVPMPGDDFRQFRISIARDDGTAVLHADRLERDSNGELRLALNSSLLPEGAYSLRIEGFTWRGDTVPRGRVRIIVAR